MAVTGDDFVARIQQQYPDFWAYLQSHPKQLAKLQSLATSYADLATGDGGKQYKAFVTDIQGLAMWSSYQAALGVATDTTDTTTTDTTTGDTVAPVVDTSAQDALDADVRGSLKQYLQQWGLETLMPFVESMITQHRPASEIIAELRSTPEYLAAFPENALRKQAGLSWWSESQILEYRDQARRLAHEYLGVDNVTNDEVAKLVSGNVSLSEWERRLQTYQAMQQWGPAVKQALSQELGFDVTDERVFAFMNPDIPTPELDQAYQNALMRGQPAVLGFGIRPEEEAQILRQYGLSPEEAFKGYQGIASELPRQQRLAMIENYINSQSNQPSASNVLGDTSFGELFRAIQLRDPEALRNIQLRMAREHARFAGGGGPVRSGATSIGLLAPSERS